MLPATWLWCLRAADLQLTLRCCPGSPRGCCEPFWSVDRAISHIRHHEEAPKRARDILERKLKEADIVIRKPTSTFSEEDHVGFYVVKNGRRTYTIDFGQRFASCSIATQQCSEPALIWLEDDGYLVSKATQKTFAQNALDRIQQTCKWPNGKSVRSIVFDDPFAKAQ